MHAMHETSLSKSAIKILLLEGVHQSALDNLHSAGYTNVEALPGSLDEATLIDKIRDVHFLGIRSRTQLSERVFAAAEKLNAVGCFCIGTNQVDLDAALARGIPCSTPPTPTLDRWPSWCWARRSCCCAVFPRRTLVLTRAAG
nr:hypothetical protein [Halomonas socia]